MNTVKQTLKNVLNRLGKYRVGCELGNHLSLAADIAIDENDLIRVLQNNLTGEHSSAFPKLAKGLDDKLYLVFSNSAEAEFFLEKQGVPRDKIFLYNFGNYENAVLIESETRPFNPHP